MKRIKISEDLLPLSRRQYTALSLVIACVFQFMFFFAPIISAQAITLSENDVQMDATSKNSADQIVSQLIESAQAQNQNIKFININNREIETKTNTDNTSLSVDLQVISISSHTITAYNSDPAQTDDTPCITANGFDVCEHNQEDTIAANFLKFGTKVRIPELYGERIFVVRDRMNTRYTSRVDIWMKDKTDARTFGVKVAKIEVVEFIN
jgi:3D (Asp-Asp-Asp) domain-containing protein